MKTAKDKVWQVAPGETRLTIYVRTRDPDGSWQYVNRELKLPSAEMLQKIEAIFKILECVEPKNKLSSKK